MFVRGDIKQEFNLKMALTSPCDGIRKGFLSSQNLINLYMVFGLARQTPPPPPHILTPLWHRENLFLHLYQVVYRIGWIGTVKRRNQHWTGYFFC